MFCPLCKAEYRQGFTECSDCHITLVSTQEEADAVKVDQLRIDDRAVVDLLLNALTDAKIPFRSREVLQSNPWPWISVFLWRFMKPKPVSDFRVDIFGRDAQRAGEILRGIVAAEVPD